MSENHQQNANSGNEANNLPMSYGSSGNANISNSVDSVATAMAAVSVEILDVIAVPARNEESIEVLAERGPAFEEPAEIGGDWNFGYYPHQDPINLLDDRDCPSQLSNSMERMLQQYSERPHRILPLTPPRELQIPTPPEFGRVSGGRTGMGRHIVSAVSGPPPPLVIHYPVPSLDAAVDEAMLVDDGVDEEDSEDGSDDSDATFVPPGVTSFVPPGVATRSMRRDVAIFQGSTTNNRNSQTISDPTTAPMHAVNGTPILIDGSRDYSGHQVHMNVGNTPRSVVNGHPNSPNSGLLAGNGASVADNVPSLLVPGIGGSVVTGGGGVGSMLGNSPTSHARGTGVSQLANSLGHIAQLISTPNQAVVGGNLGDLGGQPNVGAQATVDRQSLETALEGVIAAAGHALQLLRERGTGEGQ